MIKTILTIITTAFILQGCAALTAGVIGGVLIDQNITHRNWCDWHYCGYGIHHNYQPHIIQKPVKPSPYHNKPLSDHNEYHTK